MSIDDTEDRPYGAGRAIRETWEKLHPEDPDDVETDPDDSEDGDVMDDPVDETEPDETDMDDDDMPGLPVGAFVPHSH